MGEYGWFNDVGDCQEDKVPDLVGVGNVIGCIDLDHKSGVNFVGSQGSTVESRIVLGNAIHLVGQVLEIQRTCERNLTGARVNVKMSVVPTLSVGIRIGKPKNKGTPVKVGGIDVEYNTRGALRLVGRLLEKHLLAPVGEGVVTVPA